jgi:hypothetical protein
MTSYVRSVAAVSVWLAASLNVPISFGAGAGRLQADAQLLDHAEILCDNCFFGPSTYYYCFVADSNILVGYQKTPVLNWQDKTKNYLTVIHSRWAAWTTPGRPVRISYDEKHIWVERTNATQPSRGFGGDLKAVGKWVSRDDAKEVRLTRTSLRDIFTNDDRCRGADR